MSVISVSLRDVLPEARFVRSADVVVESVTNDSRRVQPGCVFVAIQGGRSDGHDFVAAAARNGAAAVVVSREIPDLPVPQCVVTCPATAFARLSMVLQQLSPTDLTCAGVTGTNGKTTTTWMLRAILQAARLQSGLVGTIENSDGVSSTPASLTTPVADTLAAQLRAMVDVGSTHAVMEVSSHALVQQRCAAVRFSAAAITNVTHDHLDYHGTAKEYERAKAGIVDLLHADAPLLFNAADPGCLRIHEYVSRRCPTISFSANGQPAELTAEVLTRTHRSQRLRLHLAQGDAVVRIRLIGQHNVENALAAAGLAEQLGVRLEDIAVGLESVTAVPGRLERVDEGQPFQVFVDYAHTPDAVCKVISTVRKSVPGRLICVLGAGGDRDRSKRALMGHAGGHADVCIVTSDNPRTEDPEKIVEEVAAGVPSDRQLLCETDREKAIRDAFSVAETGDAVLIAGKGHETTQVLSGETLPFDDRLVSRRLLREMVVTGGLYHHN